MPEMSLQRKILESAIEILRRTSLYRRRKMMPWEVSWFPTYTCNLRCGYCNSIMGKLEDPDPEKCIKEIIRLAPASISILGGEPYIVPDMVKYLEQIRKGLPDVFILITTNGMVKTEDLVRSMSIVDGMCISMDGLGDHTRSQREGANPDFILENIKACAAERIRLDRKPDLAVNSVVTKTNAMHLIDFYKLIAAIDPTILNFSQGMQPFTSPESIGSDLDLTKEFLNEVSKLKGSMRILLAGRLADGQLRDQSKQDTAKSVDYDTRMCDSEMHTCYQELFNIFLTPSGKLNTCRMYSGINVCRDSIRILPAHKALTAAMIYAKSVGEFAVIGPTFKCRWFQGCPEWMNDIMNCTREEDLPIEIDRVRGRLSPERIEQSVRFIQKNVNPAFKKSFLVAKENVKTDPVG